MNNTEKLNGSAALFAQVTPAEQIVEQMEIVELPLRKVADGSAVKVLVRAIALDIVLVALRGFPDVDPDKAKSETWDDVLDRIAKWKGPAEQVAQAGLVAPRVTFGDAEPGAPSWASFSFADQSAIVNAIIGLSGFGKKENAEVRRFPDQDAGGRRDFTAINDPLPATPPPVGTAEGQG